MISTNNTPGFKETARYYQGRHELMMGEVVGDLSLGQLINNSISYTMPTTSNNNFNEEG